MKALEAELGGLDLYNNTCEWDKGSSMNVAAVCCWFCTGVAMILTGPPVLYADGEPMSRRWSKKSKQSATDADAAAASGKVDAPGAADEAGASAKAPEAVTE